MLAGTEEEISIEAERKRLREGVEGIFSLKITPFFWWGRFVAMQAFGLPGRLFVCLPFPPGICGESIIAVHTAPRRQVHSTLHWGGALVGEDLGPSPTH